MKDYAVLKLPVESLEKGRKLGRSILQLIYAQFNYFFFLFLCNE
jgi:hypothetical protein